MRPRVAPVTHAAVNPFVNGGPATAGSAGRSRHGPAAETCQMSYIQLALLGGLTQGPH